MKQLLLAAAMAVASIVPAYARESIPQAVREASVYITTHGGRMGSGRSGSGFCVADNYVVTCDHLGDVPGYIGDRRARAVVVTSHSGRQYGAQIVARDTASDAMLLWVESPNDLKPLPMDKFTARRGDRVSIIGNFPGRYLVSEGSLTRESLPGSPFTLASAKVDLGYSGAPVLNTSGTIQGLLSHKDGRNNALFVNSDRLLVLLQHYENQTGSDVALVAPDARQAGADAPDAVPGETVTIAGQSEADDDAVLPAVATSLTEYPLPVRARSRTMPPETAGDAQLSAEYPLPLRPGRTSPAVVTSGSEGDDVVIAVPLRRRTGTTD